MKTLSLPRDWVYEGSLILVNAQHPYHENVAEYPLVPVTMEAPGILMNSHAVRNLSALMAKFNGWEQIAAVSGWRSMREQEEIYSQSLKENGKFFTEKYVALPGCSEHQTGLAIDLALKQENIDFICPDFPYTGICQIFRESAAAYGFVERYPDYKEKITGISHEPWHFRYVGTPHAEIMEKHNLTLEEYIVFLKHYSYGKSVYVHSTKSTQAEVSYLVANRISDTRIEIDDTVPYAISGNNVDGFIITVWRKGI